MWPRNDLTDLLEIDYPILQAPMGESTPALAVAVSNAGGLGGLGCGLLSLDQTREAAAEIRKHTNRPFNLNFFAHPSPVANAEWDMTARELLAPFYDSLGLEDMPERSTARCDPFDGERLSLLLEMRPKVVSFHFGLPAPGLVRALQDAGTKILCSATTVKEARELASAGVDAIIAQGWEAGGHRGTFHVSTEDFGVGTMALVPQVVDAVDVPVIAAGGIADGRGIAAALALGASGVQLGTAFLFSPEANIDENYRRSLRTATDDGTRLTRAFSGRPARARFNRYIREMAEKKQSRMPDYPALYSFTDPLRQAAAKSGNNDFSFQLYGQGAPLGRQLPAARLFEFLVDDTRNVLGSMSR